MHIKHEHGQLMRIMLSTLELPDMRMQCRQVTIESCCFHYQRLFNVPSSTSWAHPALKAAHVPSIHFKYCVHLLMTAA